MTEGAPPPHHAQLQGDFFCAPFGDASHHGAPLHGWPANGHWTVKDASPAHLVAVLDRPVLGAARRVKTLALRGGHPLVCQTHAFTGGGGRIGAANHAMVSLPHGGLICRSPKARWRTPPQTVEPDPSRGRSALIYQASSDQARAFIPARSPARRIRSI